MRQLHVAAFCAVAWLGAASVAHADVQVTIQDGRVTIVARDATLRQILAEWARVGQTKIVNAERVPGGGLTLQLQNIPEEQALDILLRSLSGYVAAPRPTPVSNLSRFDRILVMPTNAPATAPNSRPAGPAQPFPTQGPTSFPMPAQPAQAEDDQEGVTPNRAPTFTTFPPPQVANPQSGTTSVPGIVAPAQSPLVLPQQNAAPQQANPGGAMPPGGVAVPGMIAPAPQQPPKRPGGV